MKFTVSCSGDYDTDNMLNIMSSGLVCYPKCYAELESFSVYSTSLIVQDNYNRMANSNTADGFVH